MHQILHSILSDLRLKLDLRLADVSRMSGLSIPTIRLLEQGRGNIGSLQVYLAALHLRLHWVGVDGGNHGVTLAQGDWIKAREQIILTGQTGTGKTWLACAFGHQAARLDHSVSYVRMPRLFEDMAMARPDGRFPRLVDKLARVQLLVLDDWGTHGLTDQQRLDLLELFEERYQRRSTIITAQLPVSGWHDMIGEPTIADAILDRIVHNAHRIELKGDSMRRKDRNATLTSAENTETIRTET